MEEFVDHQMSNLFIAEIRVNVYLVNLKITLALINDCHSIAFADCSYDISYNYGVDFRDPEIIPDAAPEDFFGICSQTVSDTFGGP